MTALLCVTCLFTLAPADTTTPSLTTDQAQAWRFARGDWTIADGVLSQSHVMRQSAAILTAPGFGDCQLTIEVKVEPTGSGVRAAALIFGASGTLTYHWLHLDTKHDNAILVRSTPEKTWDELKRVHVKLDDDTWLKLGVTCQGPTITIRVGDRDVLTVDDPTRPAGRIGVGTSQASASFRNLAIKGTPMTPDQPLADQEPPFRIISRGELAGPYQAFPDVCRLPNGDLLCVFHAGYGHVSLPNDEWPQGGRICMVRSSDQGLTWSEPAILFDDADDNRDPHLAVLPDQSLICTFFSLYPTGGGKWSNRGVQCVRSTDGGQTWSDRAELLAADWAVSAPVRTLPGGSCLLGVYGRASGGYRCGGVLRSTDGGHTFSKPIPIGEDANLPLDAETDVIQLNDGRVFAALRSSKVNMHWAVSEDDGRSWSPVHDIGFKAHAPHLSRLPDGRLVMAHRIPSTALHVSTDETKTWQGPYVIDSVGGAYPSLVGLPDGTTLAIYYEEGQGSAIRAMRLKIGEDGLTKLPPFGAHE